MEPNKSEMISLPKNNPNPTITAPLMMINVYWTAGGGLNWYLATTLF